MAVIPGKKVLVLWSAITDSTAGTPAAGSEKVVSCSTNGSLSLTQNTTQVSCKDTTGGGWESAVPTTKSWEVTVDALMLDDDAAAANGLIDLTSLFITGPNDVWIVFGGTVSGEETWHGRALCTGISVNAPDGDSASYSATFLGTGALTHTTVPTTP